MNAEAIQGQILKTNRREFQVSNRALPEKAIHLIRIWYPRSSGDFRLPWPWKSDTARTLMAAGVDTNNFLS